VKTKEFELKVACLFEDWTCGRAPSIPLSDDEFTSARRRFPPDFLLYLRPHHPTLAIPAPRLVREERREAAAARRERDANPRLDRAAKKTKLSPVRWRERHIPKRLERHKEVVTMEDLKDLAYWAGAEDGHKKKGRPLGARASLGHFKPWRQGGSSQKSPLTGSVKHNQNAPPVEQIAEATELRRESIRADTATARAEAAEAASEAAEALRASAEAELGKIKELLAKKALIALESQ